jgi:hypothetical protein
VDLTLSYNNYDSYDNYDNYDNFDNYDKAGTGYPVQRAR